MWGYISEFRSNYSGEDFRISQNTESNKITLHHVVNDYSGGNGGSIHDIPVSLEDLELLKGIIEEAVEKLSERSLKVYFVESSKGDLMLLKDSFSSFCLVDFNGYNECELTTLGNNSGKWRFIEKPHNDSFKAYENLGLIEVNIAFNETIDFAKLKNVSEKDFDEAIEKAIVPCK